MVDTTIAQDLTILNSLPDNLPTYPATRVPLDTGNGVHMVCCTMVPTERTTRQR